MSRVRGALAVLAALGVAGCGVGSQDEPQPLEETSIQQPPAPPSVDTEPEPTPTVTTSSAAPTTSPSQISPRDPSGAADRPSSPAPSTARSR